MVGWFVGVGCELFGFRFLLRRRRFNEVDFFRGGRRGVVEVGVRGGAGGGGGDDLGRLRERGEPEAEVGDLGTVRQVADLVGLDRAGDRLRRIEDERGLALASADLLADGDRDAIALPELRSDVDHDVVLQERPVGPPARQIDVDQGAAAERRGLDGPVVHADVPLVRVAPGGGGERRAELQKNLAVAERRRPAEADQARREVVRRDANGFRLVGRAVRSVPREIAAAPAPRGERVEPHHEAVARAGLERLGEREDDEVALEREMPRARRAEVLRQLELRVDGQGLGRLRPDERRVGIRGILLAQDAPGLRLAAVAVAGRADDGHDGVGVQRRRAAQAIALQRERLEVDGVRGGGLGRRRNAQCGMHNAQ